MNAAEHTEILAFLFTDIQGSSRLWEEQPEPMRKAVACHDVILRSAVERNRGTVVKTTGDGLLASFRDPRDAIASAVEIQCATAEPGSTAGLALRVRCGLHAGVVESRDGDFFGSPLNRAARIMNAAHGGQVVVSQAAADLARGRLPDGVSLRDLGSVLLRDLSSPERVFQVAHPALRKDFPALRSLESTPNNLPQQVTSFVGRERELAEVANALGSNRLVTLLGSGGIGKTRLALQAGADRIEDFADGVWFVELAQLSEASLVPQEVATVLGVKEQPGVSLTDTLISVAMEKELLLILDNCEHLVEACAELCQKLLAACAKVRILAASREALRLPGELAYRLPSLASPDPDSPLSSAALTQYAAVRLFIDRAVAMKPSFCVDSANAPAVASICHHLDGIPLAIELAAARVRSMSVEEVNDRLGQRFRFLIGGARTLRARQQTLRALIDWSYDLLSAAEQAHLGWLSVFAGGWTLHAAERVCAGDDAEDDVVLDVLTSLADKSLVLAEERSGATRYRMLETVRQYARDRLRASGEEARLQARHLAYFLQLAEDAEPRLRGPEQQAWLERLETERENVRAALVWSAAVGGDTAGGLRLAGAIWRFWLMRDYYGEGRDLLSGVLAAADGRQASTARAKALNGAGALAWRQTDHPSARALHEESLATSRELGDRPGIAAALNNLGIVARSLGDYPAAEALYKESLAIRRELGDRVEIASSLNNLGNVAEVQGDHRAAQALHAEALAIRRQLGDRWGIASSLDNLGNVTVLQGDYPTGQAMHGESLAIHRELGHRSGAAFSLEGLAFAALALAAPGRAVRLWGAAERLRGEIGSPYPPDERVRYDREVAAARATMGDDAFDRTWQEGRSMTWKEAIEYALAESAR
ncbi:MAG: tetratricopeptide repeat protein [Pseudomonadota bacterium]|nr:tetratricopeptide repeat protein [Pseudomonadota bacterium]